MKKVLFAILTLCSLSGMVYGDMTWSSPTAISTPSTDASDPHITIDSGNNITVAWIEDDTVMVSTLPDGGSWSSPVALSNPLNTASKPHLDVDGSDNVTALWIESGAVQSATLPSGGSWSAATTVSASGASQASLAVDSAGNAVAVWVRSGFIESSTRISGTWSLVSVLSAANSDHPNVAISDFGIAIAVWHTVSSGADVIVSDQLTISGNTWAATKNVNAVTTSTKHNYPKVTLDPNGNANVAWFRYNFLNGNAYQGVVVLTAFLNQGGAAWSAIPTILSDVGIRNPADLTIKITSDEVGNTVAVWTISPDGETFYVESAVKSLGSTWQSLVQPRTPTLYSFGIDIASQDGVTLLTGMSFDGVSSVAITSQETSTTSPLFQTWTNEVTQSTGDDNAYPKNAMSLTGSTMNLAAAWVHFDGTNNVIHATAGTDTLIAPPTDVDATQDVNDFGAFQDYFNTITWTASTDPDVVQYNIFRNGVFFAQTDSTTFTVVDHNQENGGTVIYGVAAFTSEFKQSPIATFTINP